MRLSALAIRNAKTREKAYKLGDGHGLSDGGLKRGNQHIKRFCPFL